MAKEVRIDLTEAQKAKIKTGTGKDMRDPGCRISERMSRCRLVRAL